VDDEEQQHDSDGDEEFAAAPQDATADGPPSPVAVPLLKAPHSTPSLVDDRPPENDHTHSLLKRVV